MIQIRYSRQINITMILVIFKVMGLNFFHKCFHSLDPFVFYSDPAPFTYCFTQKTIIITLSFVGSCLCNVISGRIPCISLLK